MAVSTGSASGRWGCLLVALLAWPATATGRESGELLKVDVHAVKNDGAVVKVKFVHPVQNFKIDVPATLSLIEIGRLSAHFEDVNGNFINPGFTQFSFTPAARGSRSTPPSPSWSRARWRFTPT